MIAEPLVLPDPDAVGRLAAELLSNRLWAFPELRFLVPTGHTPHRMYAHLREISDQGRLPSSRATLLQLDELGGLGPEDERSYAAYLRRELEGIELGARFTLDGGADLEAECARHERELDGAPLGLAVLGLGHDGHVAFNEPGSGARSSTRRVELRESTRGALEGFGGDEAPREAITVGIRELRTCRELVLLVTGEDKAEVLKSVLEDPPGPDRPASLLLDHPRFGLVCDRAAAARLSKEPGSAGEALVVLGHHRHGARPGLSAEGRARLRRAEQEAEARPPDVAILSGYTSDGVRSEAEYLARAWATARPPMLLEEASLRTSDNASYSLLLLEAMPQIRNVTVVTSRSHFRARYFFSPYRRRGLGVEFAWADYPVWRGLLHELRWIATMQAERRESLSVVPPRN